MKKIKFIAAFALIISILFSSCSSKTDDIYTDDSGTQYMVCRDSNGDIQINENSKLLVYTLNENGKKIKADNGEYITEYVKFSGQLVCGKKVETKELRFTLPDGFEAYGTSIGYFSRKDAKAEIFINYYTDDISLAIESLVHSCETLLENFGSDVYSYTQYEVTVDDTQCTAFSQLGTSSEYYQNVFIYLIPYDAGYYRIDCSISTDNKNKVNYDKFIEGFEIKSDVKA